MVKKKGYQPQIAYDKHDHMRTTFSQAKGTNTACSRSGFGQLIYLHPGFPFQSGTLACSHIFNSYAYGLSVPRRFQCGNWTPLSLNLISDNPIDCFLKHSPVGHLDYLKCK